MLSQKELKAGGQQPGTRFQSISGKQKADGNALVDKTEVGAVAQNRQMGRDYLEKPRERTF